MVFNFEIIYSAGIVVLAVIALFSLSRSRRQLYGSATAGRRKSRVRSAATSVSLTFLVVRVNQLRLQRQADDRDELLGYIIMV